MSGQRYTEEFKIQAVKQVTEQGHTMTSVAERLGISYKSIHDGLRNTPSPQNSAKRMKRNQMKFAV